MPDDDVVALLPGLRLGQTEAGDVWDAEGRPRNVDVLDRMRAQPGGVLDGDHALVGGLVGQRRPGHQVADRVDAVDPRAHASVDLDQPALAQLDAGRVESEGGDVRPAPGGDDEPVDLAGLVAVAERDALVAGDDVLDERVGVDRHALALEPTLGDAGDVGVLGRQDAVERLEQQHVDAEARVRGGDLGSRGARADDGHRLRQLLQSPRLLGADHAATELGSGDGPLDRAGGQDDRRGRDLLPADGHRPAPASAPSPSIRSILFFLNSPATPPVSVEITFWRRADTKE